MKVVFLGVGVLFREYIFFSFLVVVTGQMSMGK